LALYFCCIVSPPPPPPSATLVSITTVRRTGARNRKHFFFFWLALLFYYYYYYYYYIVHALHSATPPPSPLDRGMRVKPFDVFPSFLQPIISIYYYYSPRLWDGFAIKNIIIYIYTRCILYTITVGNIIIIVIIIIIIMDLAGATSTLP